MTTDPINLICMRLKDMARVHPNMDRTHRCSKCNQLVGIYPSGQRVLRKYANVEILCHVCSGPVKNGILAPGAAREPFESVWKKN